MSTLFATAGLWAMHKELLTDGSEVYFVRHSVNLELKIDVVNQQAGEDLLRSLDVNGAV